MNHKFRKVLTVFRSLFMVQWSRSPGKTGSHYNPSSDLFMPSEKKDVITSTVCWTAMAALLVGLSFVMGPVQLLKLYGIPYSVRFSPLVLFYLTKSKTILFWFFFIRSLNFLSQLFYLSADFCNVAGFSYVLASPWPWGQTSLVSRRGIGIHAKTYLYR